MPTDATGGPSRALPALGALTEDLSFLLARANALALAAAHAALAPLGLKVRSYAVLTLACAAAAQTQRDLAEILRLDPSQIVSLVDDLEKRGLVQRQTDPSDRRSKVIAATEAGRALHVEASAAARRAEEESHARLTEDERRTLGELLRKIAFDEDPGSAGGETAS